MGRGVRHTGGKIFGEGGTQEEIIGEGYTHIRGKEARIKKKKWGKNARMMTIFEREGRIFGEKARRRKKI